MKTTITSVFIAPIAAECNSFALILAKKIRERDISVWTDTRGVRLKKKLQCANQLRSYYALIIGPDEMSRGVVQIRDLDEHIQFEGSPDYAVAIIERMCYDHKLTLAVEPKIIPEKIVILE